MALHSPRSGPPRSVWLWLAEESLESELQLQLQSLVVITRLRPAGSRRPRPRELEVVVSKTWLSDLTAEEDMCTTPHYICVEN
jgi:hypothetical protein